MHGPINIRFSECFNGDDEPYYYNRKVRHPRCVYNKLDWSVYTCLTQLYGGRDMYNLYIYVL